jgi:hypothetical protein
MSVMKINEFTEYDLTEQDAIQGACISGLQKQVIQNRVASLARQLLQLKFNPLNPTEIALEQAAIQGRLDGLQEILEQSAEAENVLKQLAKLTDGSPLNQVMSPQNPFNPQSN